MREILFRGKTEKGEWVQGVPFFEENRSYMIEDLFMCDEYNCTGAVNSYVIPETIGQYTGLTDKNGTKIFEGDIIKVEYAGNNRGLEGTAKVVFEKCKFALVWGWHNEIVCLTDFCNVTFEVISNIHDNPELLKEREGNERKYDVLFCTERL